MRFLAFEGLDGSGKSTLIQGLRQEFQRRGVPFVITREPGGTALGDSIRQMLLTTEGIPPSAKTEVLLYQAGRAQHVDQLIRPALARGEWVLCDRFAASSEAFQAGGRAVDLEEIRWLNRFSTGGLQPDLYVLLDLSVEESAKRLSGRGQDADRFELEDREFHQRVRQAYLNICSGDPARWLVLKATDTPQELLAKLISYLEKKKWLV